VAEGNNTAQPPRGLNLRGVLVSAAFLFLLLVVFAGGYGYHRDELYFLAAGNHLAWGYPDQGPLTPLLAHLMTLVAPGSLTMLRVPSALFSAGTVAVTGAICSEFGGSRRAQLIACCCTAAASVVMVVGHLLSTTTFDLLAWALVSWFAVRALRTGSGRWWLAAGGVGGVALLNKPLIAFFATALFVGLQAVGPRRVLRSPWPWLAALLMLALWSPWLVWQAEHGWPQLSVSRSIASGGSASSHSRWALVPFQFLLVSPLLAPVWLTGLWALWRERVLCRCRCFAVAWLVLVLVFLVVGGKPYYLAGMFPVLLAAGAPKVDAWLSVGNARLRWFSGAVVLSALVSAIIALPVLSERQLGPVLAMNSDAGETIGWPALARSVARTVHAGGAGTVVFTSNYGEAGAIDRYGPALGVPRAYSGHNGFAEWGPPPDHAGAVVVVGLGPRSVSESFRGCRLVVLR